LLDELADLAGEVLVYAPNGGLGRRRSDRDHAPLLVELHVDLGALSQAQAIEDVLRQRDDDAVAGFEDLADQVGSTPGGSDKVYML
jgi:hypothetical protein